MKKFKLFFLLGIFALTALTGCIKDPGNPALAANKTTVSINEEVTFTLNGVENFSCIQWTKMGDGPMFTKVSGGTDQDKTMTVKFSSAGTAKISASVKNCRKDCSGTCRTEYAEVSVTIK